MLHNKAKPLLNTGIKNACNVIVNRVRKKGIEKTELAVYAMYVF